MRSSGILMHITSLPGGQGIGTMGKEAFAFVDFLKKAGQTQWQVLPLTPTGYGDSPYQSCSTFAGNHYLIDLELLVEEGLLTRAELDSIPWSTRADKVDFGAQYRHRLSVLRLAYGRFRDWEQLDAFCAASGSWLPDFALFMALKATHGGKCWLEWEDPLRYRDYDAIWEARTALREDIRFYSFVQYLFDKQWTALRSYARQQGVSIIGDVPIYVPLDSVEVWSSPELFQLDDRLYPTRVAGCPPDAFTEDGQLWGNPLYRWEELAKDGYLWWINRLEAAGKWFDTIRLDHFRGFEAYWSVPYGDPTARGGQWVKGPGMEFLNALKKGLPGLQLIAEDLGMLTQEVLDMRDASGYPGMKVLGFAFDSREPSDYLPHTYTANTVCYTGTHDNMTTRQWFDTVSPDAAAYARSYMHLDAQEGDVWGTIRTALSTVSDQCIIPLQDYLELGGEARMNFPGTLSDSNWTWRAVYGIMTDALAERIRSLTRLYGRLAPESSV